eukprot:evm.model.scf_454.2 EVM.evm.TU.scf_454.2   scf_454:26239-27208(+)
MGCPVSSKDRPVFLALENFAHTVAERVRGSDRFTPVDLLLALALAHSWIASRDWMGALVLGCVAPALSVVWTLFNSKHAVAAFGMNRCGSGIFIDALLGGNERQFLLLSRWPFLVGFGTTFGLIFKMSLGITDEQIKKSSKLTNGALMWHYCVHSVFKQFQTSKFLSTQQEQFRPVVDVLKDLEVRTSSCCTPDRYCTTQMGNSCLKEMEICHTILQSLLNKVVILCATLQVMLWKAPKPG